MSGYFTDDSMLRVVHREQAVAFGGGRALLMMAAHPAAFEGFFNTTESLEDPFSRLERTARVLDAIGFGTKEQADTATRHVRALHRDHRASGATDPRLLLWILAALVDSSLLVYERAVRTLTAAEREAYWQDQRLVGKLFGLPKKDTPATYEAFRAYVDGMVASGELVVTPSARKLGVEVVLNPPIPLWARPLRDLFNAVTVATLPPRVRAGYGLRWDPVRDLALAAGAEWAKRVVVPLLPRRLREVSAAGRAVAPAAPAAARPA